MNSVLYWRVVWPISYGAYQLRRWLFKKRRACYYCGKRRWQYSIQHADGTCTCERCMPF